jgi:hypothetical protein
MFNEQQVQAWKPVVQAVKDKGAVFYCQLWHAGRASHPGERVCVCVFVGVGVDVGVGVGVDVGVGVCVGVCQFSECMCVWVCGCVFVKTVGEFLKSAFDVKKQGSEFMRGVLA